MKSQDIINKSFLPTIPNGKKTKYRRLVAVVEKLGDYLGGPVGSYTSNSDPVPDGIIKTVLITRQEDDCQVDPGVLPGNQYGVFVSTP